MRIDLETIRPYTVVDERRLGHLAHLAQTVPAGAIVECGTARGGSAAVLAAHSSAHLWLYDTFTGLPAPHEIDGEAARPYEGANQASVEDVHAVMSLVRVPRERYTIHAGLFARTFCDEGPDRIALLHIDADWYASVTLALEAWAPLVVPGGVIVLDDFGFWPGCRRAFYDFVHDEYDRHTLTPDLQRCGDQAWWVQG